MRKMRRKKGGYQETRVESEERRGCCSLGSVRLFGFGGRPSHVVPWSVAAAFQRPMILFEGSLGLSAAAAAAGGPEMAGKCRRKEREGNFGGEGVSSLFLAIFLPHAPYGALKRTSFACFGLDFPP